MVGGRFLQRDKCDSNYWLPLSSKEASWKISHALRDKCAFARPDEGHFSLNRIINSYSLIMKELFLETITCMLLRVPLPTQDDNNYVDHILGNEIMKLLQTAVPAANNCKCIDLYKNNTCFNCMTLHDKAHNRPYLGMQNLDPNAELNSFVKAKSTFNYASADSSIKSLEAFDSFMYVEKDVLPMSSSLLHLKTTSDTANFTSRHKKVNINYNLSVNDTTIDYSECSTSEIECLPDDFTSEDFENLISSLDPMYD
jgi:hypothetical protein